MLIRKLDIGDLEALLSLYEHLHVSDDPLPDPSLVSDVWNKAMSDRNIVYFGDFVGDALIASCNLAIIPNLTRGCRPYAVIENVVTHADYRRKGFGKQILKAAIEHAWERDCYKVMLMTGRLDEATFRFYESVGFDRNGKQAFVIKK